MPSSITRPAPDEYAPFYAGYVERVPEGDIFDLFAQQIDTVRSLLAGLSEDDANFRYAPEQWSIKEVVGHVCDAERIFAYRALRISRNDPAPLAGFDQDDYVRESDFSTRSLDSLLEEFELLRRANLIGFRNFSEAVSMRMGTASNNPVSVRALLYIMVGHVDTHLANLRDDYLSVLQAK
jgi:hypothetical protein